MMNLKKMLAFSIACLCLTNISVSAQKLQYSWANSNEHYAKHKSPELKQTLTQRIKGWKGEKLNTMITVWDGQEDCTLSLDVTDFKNKRGDILSKDQIRLNFLSYVMTDEYNIEGTHSCAFRPNPALYDSSWVADVIDIQEKLQLKKQEVAPVWVSVQVPQDLAAGRYSGHVILNVNNQEYGRLKLDIDVVNRVLPAPKDWSFHLDLWQNPYAVARYHQVEEWSQEHFDLMRPVMKALANAGQKVITTSIMHKPWNGQTFDYFESMIVWRKTLEGEWKFTFDVFDKWVEFMMSVGIDRQINCYSMVPWSYSFQYFDERTNRLQALKCKPGEPVYNEVWTAFLKAFTKHLKEKGWFEKTCIAMDERPMPVMKTIISLVRKVDPNFKLSLAGLYYKDIEKELHDYCISTNQSFPKEVIARRERENRVTTYYTFCADEKPNCFTFSEPAESAWMPLYSAKLGLNGYLRWAYNSWVKDPLQDSRFRQWPAGDTYLVYPGYRSSVRFEKLIEGIQLFEKIRILKANKSAARKLDKALQSLEIKALKAKGIAEADVNKIKQLSNSL